MTNTLKEWWVMCLFISLASSRSCKAEDKPQVPCYYIFGDSLFDNGNNNDISTNAKANYLPYGINFPRGPTGRFSNGRNQPDIIAKLLGFKNYIPTLAGAASGKKILKGVNYASGAAGIRDESGRQRGCISLNKQLKNHQTTISNIIKLSPSKESAMKHLNKCLYTVGMGSNDYINNYFIPKFYKTSRQFTPDKYAADLIQKYSQQLKTLYSYGARKVALFGVGRIGCTPQSIAAFGTNGSLCVDKLNSAALLFNKRLISLVHDLNKNLSDATFTYINTFGSSTVDYPALGYWAFCPIGLSKGFTVTNASCCKVKSGEDICIPYEAPCQNASQYLFWDGVHPTDSLNVLMARSAYAGPSPTGAYPFNLSRLAQL